MIVRNRDIWLAATLADLADARPDLHDAEYARRLVDTLTELLGPAESGLLLDDGAGSLTTAAVSTERVRELLSLESRNDDGPCTSCYHTGRRVFGQPLPAADVLWPTFAPAARAAGFLTVSALPMRRNSEIIGAVGILCTRERPLAELEADLAQIVAEAATIGILHQRALRLSIQTSIHLQRALDSRVIIEQAKGVVAARRGTTPDAAFDLLRAYARRHNLRLADVASLTVDGGLSAHDLVPG